MATECLGNCPRITELAEGIKSKINTGGAVIPEGGKDSKVSRILLAAQESYDCDGPVDGVEFVERGIIRKKIVQEPRTYCGLDEVVLASSEVTEVEPSSS